MPDGKELPKYKCHKVVHAIKIARIANYSEPYVMLHLIDSRYSSIKVTKRWAKKHQPEPGGYFVVYSDGYESFSPAKAFEEGYTLIEEVSDPVKLD